MKECIAIINQKGGVGKSTTANALGAGLTSKCFKVLYPKSSKKTPASISGG